MSDQPIHTYNFSELEVFEVGAALVALLAYPEANSEQKRSALHASLCALALRAIYPADSDAAHLPQPMKPVYALRPEHATEKDLRTLKRRLRDRMIAGRMAIAFLQKTQGITPKMPATTGRLSINVLSGLVTEDAGYTDPANVETRIWRPSLPVIHLAAAIQVILQAASERFHLGHLILSRPWIELVISTARQYERLLADAHFRGIDSAKLIKIRLGGDS